MHGKVVFSISHILIYLRSSDDKIISNLQERYETHPFEVNQKGVSYDAQERNELQSS